MASLRSYEHIECRTLGHSWDPGVPAPPDIAKPSFGYRAYLRCDRCGTYRVENISRVTGEVLARWYIYPDNYATQKHTRDEFRKELVRRKVL